MQLRVGYELIYDCPHPTPMMLMLNIHHTRASDIVVPDCLTTNPSVPLEGRGFHAAETSSDARRVSQAPSNDKR